ncbi:MAG: substrate-binding domain-containing protein [Akkermansiaceae bacterium]
MENALRIKSASEQVADHLREELIRGTWSGTMPGETQLLAKLGVGRDTIKIALTLLEKEGILINQGPGRRRRISLPKSLKTSPLRIGILCYDENDRASRTLIELFHSLIERGHTAFFAGKTSEQLGLNVQRISRLIENTKADAWIVSAGPRDILEWFVKRKIPVFSLFGARIGLPIGGIGPNHGPALREAVRKLVKLGHRRIVSLNNRGRHTDEPGYTDQLIFEEMETESIPWSSYNFPSWDNDQDGFRRCLDSLFAHTPPSALIIEEPTYFFATLQFCGDKKLRVPENVSLICSEHAASFDFAKPSLSYIAWDYRPMVRRMTQWADNISRGKEDKRQTRIKTNFVEGGTIGPAPSSSITQAT